MKKNKKIIVLLAAVLLLAIVGGVAAFYRQKTMRRTTPITSTDQPNVVNYGPPTDEEKRETDDFKKNHTDAPPPPPTTPDGQKKQVTPVITFAGQYDAEVEVSAYVPAILEDGGTCTAQFKHDSTTVTKTSQGVKDATTTRCGLVTFPAKELTPKGSWSVTVTYSSPTAQGASQSTNFEVK